MDKFFKQVDQNENEFVKFLADSVAIPSVSAQKEHRKDCYKMADFLVAKMKSLNMSVQIEDVGLQQLEGEEIKLPSVILASYPATRDPSKKTVLVYGHYDVQPALREDGWDSDPFTLTEVDGKMFGRGSSDDKGPLLNWLNIVDCHEKMKLPLPVNLIVCTEGMEESGSEGLDALIERQKDKYFKHVDFVCISDNYWLGTEKPCLTYGLRGVSYFQLSVHGPPTKERQFGKDLHSGVFGKTIYDPLTDLIHLMSRLVSPQGEILVEGIQDQVAPLTDAEKKRYESLEFSMESFLDSTGTTTPLTENVSQLLMNRWRYPTLSLHGIQNAFSAPGEKTVIPGNPIGKFSIRTVPNMEPAKVTELVKKYVDKEFAKLNSKNVVNVKCAHAGKWWLSSPDHPNYVAAAKAIKTVFGVDPDYTREGGSIPVTLTFEQQLQKNVLLLPIGQCDDGAHSAPEKISRSNYIKGLKLMGAYLYELAKAEKI